MPARAQRYPPPPLFLSPAAPAARHAAIDAITRQRL